MGWMDLPDWMGYLLAGRYNASILYLSDMNCIDICLVSGQEIRHKGLEQPWISVGGKRVS